jgi:hypothetical protein
LYGNSAKNAPIYLEGSSVIINNDAGTGNVGIGTTNPGAKLDVSGGNARIISGSSPTLDIWTQGTMSTSNASRIRLAGDTGSWFWMDAVGNRMRLSTGGSPADHLVLYYNGNVGIGTAAPGYKLTVYGQGNFSRDNAAECCSGGDFTLSVAENTAGTGRKAKIEFHNAGYSEGYIRLDGSGSDRRLVLGDHQNWGMGLEINGNTNIKASPNQAGNLYVSGTAYANGQALCQANGVNCPGAAAETDPTVPAQAKGLNQWVNTNSFPTFLGVNFSPGTSLPSADGAIYRYNGQAEIMVDDHLYIRQTGGNANIDIRSDLGNIWVSSFGWISDAAKHRGEGSNFVDYAYGLYDAYRGGWRASNDLYVAYAYSAGNADTVDGWHRDDIRYWGNLTGKPGNLTYWDSWYGSSYLGSNGDLYMGWDGRWLSQTINQDVRNGASPTFAEVYVNGWFRNVGRQGIYNSSYGTHFYTNDANYWRVSSNYGMIINSSTAYDSAPAGYLYHEGTNNIGLLHSGGGWAVRAWNGGVELYGTSYANGGVICASNNNCGYTSSACPSGFNDTGYGYCIQADKAMGGGVTNYYNANSVCSNLNARLCTPSEWYIACRNGKANNMTSSVNPNSEWVSQLASDPNQGDGAIALGRNVGKDGTRCSGQEFQAVLNNVTFRCCRNK